MHSLLQALGLLTALPVRVPRDEGLEAEPGRAMWAYPLAGAVIGLGLLVLGALLHVAGIDQKAPLLAAALVLVAWCALTGALHLDGWADCCDALFVPVTRERRLEILHDPRLGSFGGVGLVLLLLVKLAAIQGLLAGAPAAGAPATRPAFGLLGTAGGGMPLWPAASWPLLVAPVVARWCMVLAAVAFPLARPDGMAAYFRRGAGRREVIVGGVVTGLVCAAWGPAGLALWAVSALVTWALARLASARLGGLTGDVYGATAELVEVTALVIACLL
jgi:adenosylcobinamide-GDP ribazoletransferase